MSIWLLFACAVLAVLGVYILGLAVYFGVKAIFTPAPKSEWEREWEEIERNISE